MDKALRQDRTRGQRTERKPTNWTKRASDHVAGALLVYTALHILVTMQAIKGEGGSILPYFGLVLLVAMIIPACRLFEKRWERLGVSDRPPAELNGMFHRDLWLLWIAALGLPVVVTGLIKGLLALV